MQITDDSELAICLADGLIAGGDPSRGFPDEACAERYKAWYRSPPFDIGEHPERCYFEVLHPCLALRPTQGAQHASALAPRTYAGEARHPASLSTAPP